MRFTDFRHQMVSDSESCESITDRKCSETVLKNVDSTILRFTNTVSKMEDKLNKKITEMENKLDKKFTEMENKLDTKFAEMIEMMRSFAASKNDGRLLELTTRLKAETAVFREAATKTVQELPKAEHNAPVDLNINDTKTVTQYGSSENFDVASDELGMIMGLDSKVSNLNILVNSSMNFFTVMPAGDKEGITESVLSCPPTVCQNAKVTSSTVSAIYQIMPPTPGTCHIEQLPDEILFQILLFLPSLAETARTSILGRKWRNIWHQIDWVHFDPAAVLPLHLFNRTHAWRYVACVNKVIDIRNSNSRLSRDKEFRVWFGIDASHGQHIDRWIRYAIENQVEKLHLNFRPYRSNISLNNQYKLSEESWYGAPSGLSSLKYLKSLLLSNVNVSKQFIEFILSSCPLLEDLSLAFAGRYGELTICGVPPLRLKRLSLIISLFEDFVLAKLDAPYLTSLTYCANRFHPEKIDVPKLTDLTIGSVACPQLVMDYLDHFWSYLPQLEKLELIMKRAANFVLNEKPKLVKLKYLKIHVFIGGCDAIACEIIDFIKACPLLETFAFQVEGETPSPHQNQDMPGDSYFKFLKVLKLEWGSVESIDQEVTNYLIRRAPHLKKVVIVPPALGEGRNREPSDLKTVQALEAKAKELCEGSCSDNIEITVVV